MGERKPRGYWTKDRCKEEALKYDSRFKFQQESNGAYGASYKNGWLDIVCFHMIINDGNNKRCIYAYEFNDKHVYVGLTYNLSERHKSHMNPKKQSSVYEYMTISGLVPLKKQLTEFILTSEAVELENYYVDYYKNNGWYILNKIKTGSIGGCKLLWSYDNCKKEALKYKTKTEFRKKCNSAYLISLRNKWIDDICKHMIKLKQPIGFWDNYENCKHEALKYKYKTEFINNSRTAYEYTKKNNWVDKLCSHMKKRGDK